MKLRQFFPLLLVALLAGGADAADPQSIILASTTSVENSGLLAHILPVFTKETGITVHVLAQGTGQALQTAARDDADLVLVHDPEAERKFIAAGDGIDRRQIAWNDFIVVGPRSDPPHIAGSHDAVEIGRVVTPYAGRKNFSLPFGERQRNALQCLNCVEQCINSAAATANALPARQERAQRPRLKGLNFPPQSRQAFAPKLLQHVRMHPLAIHATGTKTAFQKPSASH